MLSKTVVKLVRITKRILKDNSNKQMRADTFWKICSDSINPEIIDREGMVFIAYIYYEYHNSSIDVKAFEDTFHKILESDLNICDFVTLEQWFGNEKPILKQVIKEKGEILIYNAINKNISIQNFISLLDFFSNKEPIFNKIMNERGKKLVYDFISLRNESEPYSLETILNMTERIINILNDLDFAVELYMHIIKKYAKNIKNIGAIGCSLNKNFNHDPSGKKLLIKKLFINVENNNCKLMLALISLGDWKSKYFENYIYDYLCVNKTISVQEFINFYRKIFWEYIRKKSLTIFIRKMFQDIHESSTDVKELCQIVDYFYGNWKIMQQMLSKIIPLIRNNDEYVYVLKTCARLIFLEQPVRFRYISDALIEVRSSLKLANGNKNPA